MWVEGRLSVVLQVLVAQVWFLIRGSPWTSPGRRNTSVLTQWLLFAGGKCWRRETMLSCSPAWLSSVSWDITCMQQEFVFHERCICLHGKNCWEALALDLGFVSLITVCYIQHVCVCILYIPVVPGRNPADSSLEKHTPDCNLYKYSRFAVIMFIA